MKKFFTVIGGMGSLATESYVRVLNKRIDAKKDQDYPDYILLNHATVPDRTAHILDHSKESFLPYLKEDIEQQSKLDPQFFIIICNTAHYYYKELQDSTNVPILNMPHIAIEELKKQYPNETKIGLIATRGTIADGIYKNEIENAGYQVEIGDEKLQDDVNKLIYDNIKEKGTVDSELYHQILDDMKNKFDCNVIVLGCTELSLADEVAGSNGHFVIDAQSIIVDKSIELYKKVKKEEAIDFNNI